MVERRHLRVNTIVNSHVKRNVTSQVRLPKTSTLINELSGSINSIEGSVVEADVHQTFDGAATPAPVHPARHAPTETSFFSKIPIVNATLQILKLLFPYLFTSH